MDGYRVWITPPGTQMYGGRNDPGIVLPEDTIYNLDPKRHKLYAMRGWCSHVAVYDFVDDKWLGFYYLKGDNETAEEWLQQGKAHSATKPYQDW